MKKSIKKLLIILIISACAQNHETHSASWIRQKWQALWGKTRRDNMVDRTENNSSNHQSKNNIDNLKSQIALTSAYLEQNPKMTIMPGQVAEEPNPEAECIYITWFKAMIKELISESEATAMAMASYEEGSSLQAVTETANKTFKTVIGNIINRAGDGLEAHKRNLEMLKEIAGILKEMPMARELFFAASRGDKELFIAELFKRETLWLQNHR